MGTDIHSVFQKKTPGGWADVESSYEEERHYALFAWLGNVRNGFGFAGVTTHIKIEPLSSNRGFPEDFEIAEGEDHGEKWMGDHSHSWLSADEILKAEPPQVLRTGLVDVAFFKSWDGVSSPDSWSGGAFGPGVYVAESPDEVEGKTTHVRIEWFDDFKERFAGFTNEVQRLKKLHGEVRFVFGFDS